MLRNQSIQRSTRRWCAVGLVAVALLCTRPLRAASAPAPRGSGGAVASAEAPSTEAGLELLRRGGNAVDAAVATALTMAVVHPQAGNLGGGGFAVLKIGEEIFTLDFRETAPAGARRDMYLDETGEAIPKASLVGPLAAGVPGSIRGLFDLHRAHGHLPWREVVQPAIRAAADGFVVTRRLTADLKRKQDLLQRFPETAAIWLHDGEPLEAGSTIRLPALATTLERYAEHGPEALTRGPLADAVEAASERYGGILTAADLAAYRPEWREPVRFEAWGWSFAAMDLPSSGGIILGQTLQLLERLDWGALPRWGADRYHLQSEVWRRAFADRYQMGDPSSTQVVAAELLATERLRRQAAEIDRRRAAPSVKLLPASAGAPTEAGESTETVHLAVIDAEGNAVAMTTTLNGTFGCGLLVAETGYLLNNEMDDFATRPGSPNMFGLVQGEANAVAPGRRMLSSMSPTVAWRGGEVISLGGRGGSRIPTATATVLLNLLVDGDPLQTAIDRPRIHHQWLPDQITPEPDALSPETRAALEASGHKIEPEAETAKVNAARRLADGSFEAAGDVRGPSVGGVVHPVP